MIRNRPEDFLEGNKKKRKHKCVWWGEKSDFLNGAISSGFTKC